MSNSKTEKTARAPKASTRKTPAKARTATKTKTTPLTAAALPLESVTTDALLARASAYTLFVRRAVHHLAASLEGGAISIPAGRQLRAGTPLIVTYFTDAAALNRPDLELQQVTMHWRVGGEDQPNVLVAKRAGRVGVLERLPTTLLVPAGATGELEYWFELQSVSGETLWDSNYGDNFRLSLAAPVKANGEAQPGAWETTHPLPPAVQAS